MSSGGNISATEGKSSGTRPAFLAFTADAETAAVLKQFVQANGWEESAIQSGDITGAATFLKSHPSPRVLFVDIPSAEAASAALNSLADVCEPGVKVIVSGKVNEYSFYCWLMEMGISSYLLKPLTLAAIEAAYRKSIEGPAATAHASAAEAKKVGKIIAVMGSRGGVGATTMSVNIAWVLAHELHQKTALLDFDPQLGTVALALDLEPGKGLRDALEKPDRIDGLFMDRVMVKIDDTFSILSTEESLEEYITPNEAAAEALFTQTRPKFSHIVVDLPRVLSSFTRYALRHADHVVCVTEYTITGLRESLRYLEYCRDALKIAPPLFVANRVGLAGKQQVPQEEFEKGLGAKIAFNIPFALEAYAAATAGHILVETAKQTPMTKALHALASHFVPGMEVKTPQTPMEKLRAFVKGGK